jgi:hypothetical protein
MMVTQISFVAQLAVAVHVELASGVHKVTHHPLCLEGRSQGTLQHTSSPWRLRLGTSVSTV